MKTLDTKIPKQLFLQEDEPLEFEGPKELSEQ